MNTPKWSTPVVVLAVLLTSFFNHGWTQINTDTGICIRVYLRPFAVKNSVINDASHSLVIKNGGVHREVS